MITDVQKLYDRDAHPFFNTRLVEVYYSHIVLYDPTDPSMFSAIYPLRASYTMIVKLKEYEKARSVCSRELFEKFTLFDPSKKFPPSIVNGSYNGIIVSYGYGIRRTTVYNNVLICKIKFIRRYS